MLSALLNRLTNSQLAKISRFMSLSIPTKLLVYLALV